MKRICRTTDGAANTVLYPVLTPEVGEKCGGEYFETGKVQTTNPQANRPEIQKRLWERSLQLTHDANANSSQNQEYGRRTDEVVVMTGGSNGIGVSIVKKLLQLDYTIILGMKCD
ncbi:Short-chain dehydrogenase TIC 32, chloroplastic [Orchesella cincta]|uniref:Short-chain dehydrogenase TIC 32, chloroplastic n=1 Tax=Orchesella cincta TaxID=48709 RepID=A0A1D2MQW6_ORCCI|nr:Short-chain dehydrogenase TIC 32, chloroplastic [Orchesella cincta]